MSSLLRPLIYLLLSIAFVPMASPNDKKAEAQPEASQSKSRQIAVFLDASWQMDKDYVREHIPLVRYVRDKEQADIHILITRHEAGVAGTNYFALFMGNNEFAGQNKEMSYFASRSSTSDEVRRGYTQMIKNGLDYYLSESLLPCQVDIPSDQADAEPDPWNHWIFELYGGGNFNKEETRSSVSSRFGFYADRITTEWKFRVRPYFNFSESRFVTNSDTIISRSHRHGYQFYLIRGVNDHWSAGIFSQGRTSTFHNMHYNAELTPAVEYSLYPYSEATRRSVTFAYRLGMGYNNYLETTIFNQDQEWLLKQSLEAAVQFNQSWGSIRAGLMGSHYFHDFSANRAELFTNLNIRVFQGLSVSARIDLYLINDLISIPAGDLSLEEILLVQKQRSTSYSLSGTVGLTYTFGSVYTPVFNPRL